MIVTIQGIPVYNAVISDEETGMFRISLVDDPAVKSNFMAFNQERQSLMYSVQDEERRLVRGVVMRADFPIIRKNASMGEYYVIYKADQIRKMAEKYLLEARQNAVNIMHVPGTDVEGVQMVQYFIKDTAAGVNPAGFEDISDGSLFAEFHVVNDDVWAEIKAGTFKGFSLEGVFDLVPETDKDDVQATVDLLEGAFRKLTKNSNMSKLALIRAALAKALQEYGSITTDKGVLAWDGDEDLKAGDSVFVEDAEGNRTAAPDGDYMTEDGKTIAVADGKVAEIRDPEAEVAPEPEAEAETEQAFAAVATDKGDLSWDGEDELKAGDAVFQERDGERVPAEDGEYKTEDGKVIVVVEGVVAEIRDPEAEVAPEAEPAEQEDFSAIVAEVENLRKENTALRAEVEELRKRPAAKPAHEEFRGTVLAQKTGVKRLDNLARLLSK